MLKSTVVSLCGVLFLGFSSIGLAQTTLSPALNINKIQRIIGVKGTYNPNTPTYKVTIPRNDLKISINDTSLPSMMGVTSWIAFQKNAVDTHVTGELALTEDQVNPLISLILKTGLQVTSLENHFMWESSRIMFLHIEGSGDEIKLAMDAAAIFKKMHDTTNGQGEFPYAKINFADTTLHPRKLDLILGTKGNLNNGVYQVKLNHQIPHAPGIHSWAAFAGSDQEAIVDGEFTLQPSELQKVLGSLRSADIGVSAIHHYKNEENQDVVLVHYWGAGNTKRLAHGVHNAAIAAINTPSIKMTATQYQWQGNQKSQQLLPSFTRWDAMKIK